MLKKKTMKRITALGIDRKLGFGDKVFVMNDFVPNEDVNKYFQVSDAIVLYYLYATPSGSGIHRLQF
jgi:hypothetical protein